VRGSRETDLQDVVFLLLISGATLSLYKSGADRVIRSAVREGDDPSTMPTSPVDLLVVGLLTASEAFAVVSRSG